MLKQGFIIGNHSYTHKPFSHLSFDEIIQEIEKTDEIIKQAYALAEIRRPVKLIRFPYGDRPSFFIRKKIYEAIKQKNYRLWFWSLDTKDWEPKSSVNSIVKKISKAKEKDIILFHERFKTARELFEPSMDKLHELNLEPKENLTGLFS